MSDSFLKGVTDQGLSNTSIDGSVVECSPATRAARVRFPVDANLYTFSLNVCGITTTVLYLICFTVRCSFGSLHQKVQYSASICSLI